MIARNFQYGVMISAVLVSVAAFGQDTTWVDNTGKFRVEASFLRLEEDILYLRRTDDREIAVPLIRLSAESREQAHRLHRDLQSKAESPLPLVATDGPPPELPPMPGNLDWDEQGKKRIDNALANYGDDQVSAYLTFREILDRKQNGPTMPQRQWLERAVEACRPRALAVVQADFDQAIENADLRLALVASIVARKIHPAGVGDNLSSLGVLKNLLFSRDPPPQPVWKLEDVQAKEIVGEYSEGSQFARNRVTITPKKGFRLVRVTASVTNFATQADPPYVGWSLSGFKSPFEDPISRAEAKEKKSRLAQDDFIFFVTPAGDWIQCSHVCDTSTGLRRLVLTMEKQGLIITLGGYLSADDSFKMDVLFSIPQGIEEGSLLLLGADPQPLAFAGDS